MTKPRLGLLLGDPTGIGPEIVAKLLAGGEIYRYARPVLLTNRRWWEQGQRVAGTNVAVRDIDEGDWAAVDEDGPPCLLHMPWGGDVDFPLGQVDADAGAAVGESLKFALRAALAGHVDAITFAPLNKEALNKGGLRFPDEHVFFADFLGWKGPFGEMNYARGLWTARVTSHIPLREVPRQVTTERIGVALRLCFDTLRRFGIEEPRIGVAALNPHGGEHGLFGDEEIRVIEPALEKARNEGIPALGPFPADTIFRRALNGELDAVLSMYHDQGQIALKLLGFQEMVTVSAGLPLPITTPSHGTAHDIAGQGKADYGALLAACQVAARMAANKELQQR